MRGTTPQIFKWGDLAFSAKFTLAAGASLLIPDNRVPLAVISSDGDITDLICLLDYDGTLSQCDTNQAQALWSPRGANTWCPLPVLAKGDGVLYSLKNSGVNPIADIVYAYFECE